MKYPKVLVAGPQNIAKKYCFDDWLANVKSFTYPNFGIYLSDNSEKNDFSKYINKQGDVLCEWIKPKSPSQFVLERMAQSHDMCRQMALHHDWDYLLHLETDVFPPPHIIEMLLSAKRYIIGAWYHIGNGMESHPMIQVMEDYTAESNIDTRFIKKETITFLDGTVKRAFHCGLGCILIHKSVLRQFNFRLGYGNMQVQGRSQVMFPDICFSQDMHFLGQDIWVDTSIICEHRNSNEGWVNFAK